MALVLGLGLGLGFNPFATGSPFLGTKLLGFSIGRGSGAPKGRFVQSPLSYDWNQRCQETVSQGKTSSGQGRQTDRFTLET